MEIDAHAGLVFEWRFPGMGHHLAVPMRGEQGLGSSGIPLVNQHVDVHERSERKVAVHLDREDRALERDCPDTAVSKGSQQPEQPPSEEEVAPSVRTDESAQLVENAVGNSVRAGPT